MKNIILIIVSIISIQTTAQLTELDNTDTKFYMTKDTMYCPFCALEPFKISLALAAKEQLEQYHYYDASEYKLSKWGEQVSHSGCCIDVLLRAWQNMSNNKLYRRYGNISDKHWQSEIEKLGITHMGLDYIYYRWRTQNGADLTQWKKDGGRNLAHRRCRNIVKLFQKEVIPCIKLEAGRYTTGAIIFFKSKQLPQYYWHVGICINEKQYIHNIGSGVEIVNIDEDLNDDNSEIYILKDLSNNLYNFKAK